MLTPDYDERSSNEVLATGAEPISFSLARTGMNPFCDLRDMWRLAGLFRRLAPQVVLCCQIKPVIYGTMAARMAGVPRRVAMVEGAGYIFTNAGTISRKKRLLRTIVSMLYRAALSQAHRVLFLNRDDCEMFVASGMVKGDRIERLPGIGVDLARFPVAPLPEPPVMFAFVGRLLLDKGIRDFVAAAQIVKRDHPETRFVLLGSLDENPSSVTAEEVSEWVRSGMFEWPGYVTDVRPWITQTSVFVLPSFREGLPRSTQEAMAMGRAVITTDVPGCRETVEDGVNGFLVPVRDPARLAEAMLRFVRNPDLITGMGAASRRIAEEKYDVHKVNARLLTVLNVGRVADS